MSTYDAVKKALAPATDPQPALVVRTSDAEVPDAQECPRCQRPLVPVDGRWPGHQITVRRSPFCVMSGKPVA